MLIPNQQFLDGAHEWHLEVLSAFDRRAKRFFMLKWHRRARKTTLIINLLIRECMMHPKSVYPYVGPTYKQAKSIIWRDPNMLFTYLPPQEACAWVKNESELSITFPNGSILPIKGADDPDSLRGIDARGVGFDEWDFMKPSIWFEIFRPIITQNVNRWAIFGYTPAPQGHAADMWNDAQDWEDWYLKKLTVDDSGLLAREELLKAQREMPEAMYRREFLCDDITHEEMTVITSLMLEELRHVVNRVQPDTRRIISCDPAAGGNECVIYAFENETIIDEQFLYERDLMKIAGHLVVMGEKHGINNYVIDGIGLGKGVIDRLVEMGKDVTDFNSSEAAIDSDQYRNKRAEAWWYVSELIRDHLVDYPQDPELRKQLSAVHYRIIDSSGKTQLQPKKEVMKESGRGCDRADAFVMGIYELQYVIAETESDWHTRHRQAARSPMLM